MRKGPDGMAVAPGQSFGNFQVVRLLGEGGFGEVYEAENPFLQRRAAIKVLHTGMVHEPELVRRFLNEARAASAIRHPNIIDVFDAGITPSGEPYILMEFLEGDSLQQLLLQRGRMPLRMVQEIARQAGSALSAAHAAGIVHRDLKPENLFVIPDMSMPLGVRVKVLDFGIAKVKHREDQGSTVRTQAGLLMGSPAYMSPEQCRDSSDVDIRSDVYSLAVIVYELLAGVPPFASKSATEMLVLQITAEPPPLRQQVPDIPDYVEQSVMRALAKDREERYAAVDYFVGALHGTYPAQTSPGNSASTSTVTGMLAGPESPDGSRPQRTPAPVSVGDPFAGAAATSTITTLSQATGEAGRAPFDPEWNVETARRRRWPLVMAAAGALVAGAVFLALRPRSHTAPAATMAPPAVTAPAATTILASIRTDPPGATVLDSEGTSIGITPLQKSFAKASASKSLLVRLAGHKEQRLTITLDENSTTVVDLEPETVVAAPANLAAAPKKPPAVSRKRQAASAAGKEAGRPHDEEEQWRVH